MMIKQVGVIAAALWLAAFVATAQGAATRDPGTHFFDQSLGDFSEELQVAREAGKSAILVMFEMDECPFCYRMKQTVLNQVPVQDYFKKHFQILSVDIEGDVEMTDFQGNSVTQKDFAFKQNRVRATPVFAFFDLDGSPIKPARFTGATNGPEEFLLLGRYVVEGVYKQMSFTRFKRDQRKPQ
jgi:thioredoxin-related protein